MNNVKDIEGKIGFDKIREKLYIYCNSELGKEEVDKIKFTSSYDNIKLLLTQTSEFANILSNDLEFPVDNYYDMRKSLSRIRIEGLFLSIEEIVKFRKSLQIMRQILRFFNDKNREAYPNLYSKAVQIKFYPYLIDEIDYVINSSGKIKDSASPELATIRRFIHSETSRISKRMNALLSKAKSDGYANDDDNVTVRDGRLMLPIKSGSRRKIKGVVFDESASGKTIFVEPTEIIEINNQLKEAENKEAREIVRILKELSNKIRPYISEVSESYKVLAFFDFTRAKAVLANELSAINIKIDNYPVMNFRNAINPLLHFTYKNTNKKVIANNLQLTKENRVLLISGPNAGGKSVAMKTTGLLQYMLQCGLLIPVSQESYSGIFDSILIDIGDDQSIDNDLSTYSSHLTNMKNMLKKSTSQTLILIDEFGSGTEPILGGAIAEAVLHKLIQIGVYGVITTHYSNLKHYAANNEFIINGAMLFDIANIKPLYKLEIGKPGSSFAIEIANKIGLPKDVVDDAKQRAGSDQTNFDKHLREILRDKKYLQDKRNKIKQTERKLSQTLESYEKELVNIKKERTQIISEAKLQAQKTLDDSNKLIENTIRKIKEAEAQKEKTKDIRNEHVKNRKGILKNIEKQSDLDNKLARIEQKAKKHKKADADTKNEPQKIELEIGCTVRIHGKENLGEVVELNNKNVVIAFGQFITTVSRSKVDVISNKQKKKIKKKSNVSSSLLAKRATFKPGIDIRGKYPDEAIQLLTEFIDQAVILGVEQVKILHGKGSGILRKVVRDFLNHIKEVKSFDDEHVDFGGAGITVVNLRT